MPGAVRYRTAASSGYSMYYTNGTFCDLIQENRQTQVRQWYRTNNRVARGIRSHAARYPMLHGIPYGSGDSTAELMLVGRWGRTRSSMLHAT